MNTGIIVLAAGSSSRMGQSKQLMQVDGLTLLERTIRIAKEITSHVIVVLGSQYALHEKAIFHLSVEIVQNKNWEMGMGTSLKAAISHPIIDSLDSLIVVVCDQPMLSAEHLRQLIDKSKLESKSIVASRYGNTIGVPAFFQKSYFSVLRKVVNHAGAKQIINSYIEEVEIVDFEGGEIDLDTQMAFNEFTNRKK